MLNSCKNRNVEVTLDMRLGTRYDKEISDTACFIPATHVKDCSGTGIMAWIQTHGLRSLKYKGTHRDFPQLLVACSSTLANLDLDIGDYCMSLPSLELHLFKN